MATAPIFRTLLHPDSKLRLSVEEYEHYYDNTLQMFSNHRRSKNFDTSIGMECDYHVLPYDLWKLFNPYGQRNEPPRSSEQSSVHPLSGDGLFGFVMDRVLSFHSLSKKFGVTITRPVHSLLVDLEWETVMEANLAPNPSAFHLNAMCSFTFPQTPVPTSGMDEVQCTMDPLRRQFKASETLMVFSKKEVLNFHPGIVPNEIKHLVPPIYKITFPKTGRVAFGNQSFLDIYYPCDSGDNGDIQVWTE